MDNIVSGSNCMSIPALDKLYSQILVADGCCTVDRDEVDRLRKRFMKLDKVCPRCCCSSGSSQEKAIVGLIAGSIIMQDNSGTIEREEFLSLPQVSSNPLATRLPALHFPTFTDPRIHRLQIPMLQDDCHFRRRWWWRC